MGSNEVTCPHCKLAMRYDATLCPHCRTAATAEEIASRDEDAASRDVVKAKRRNGCLWLIAAPILLIFGVGIITSLRDKLDPEGAAQREFDSNQSTYAFLIKKCLQGDMDRCASAQDTTVWGEHVTEDCAHLARMIETLGNKGILYGQVTACRNASHAMAAELDELFGVNRP